MSMAKKDDPLYMTMKCIPELKTDRADLPPQTALPQSDRNISVPRETEKSKSGAPSSRIPEGSLRNPSVVKPNVIEASAYQASGYGSQASVKQREGSLRNPSVIKQNVIEASGYQASGYVNEGSVKQQEGSLRNPSVIKPNVIEASAYQASGYGSQSSVKQPSGISKTSNLLQQGAPRTQGLSQWHGKTQSFPPNQSSRYVYAAGQEQTAIPQTLPMMTDNTENDKEKLKQLLAEVREDVERKRKRK